jgi:hypothetical protein
VEDMNMKIGILAIGIIALIAAIPVAMAASTDDHGPSPKIELDNNTINFLAFENTDYYVINVTTGMNKYGNYIDPPYIEFTGDISYNKGKSYQVLFFLTQPEGTSPNSIACVIPENLGLLYPVSVEVFSAEGEFILEIQDGLWLDLNYI